MNKLYKFLSGVDISRLKSDLYKQGVKDREILTQEAKKREVYKYINPKFFEDLKEFISNECKENEENVRVRIFIGEKLDMSFTAKVPKATLTEDDIASIFKELVNILESPTEQDDDLF